MIEVKYVHPARLLNEQQVEILTSNYIPVVELSALAEVVEGLKGIIELTASPEQFVRARICSTAQRLLAQLAPQKEGE